jgi:hypothetical protein
MPAQKTLQMRHVKPGMQVLDDLGEWQTVTRVETDRGFTRHFYADGSEEQGDSSLRVKVRSAPSVEPNEATRLPDIKIGADPDFEDALRDLATAVNGFPYPGERSSALIDAVKWLRTRPDMCARLGLTVTRTP